MQRMIRVPWYRVRLERWKWLMIGLILGLAMGLTFTIRL